MKSIQLNSSVSLSSIAQGFWRLTAQKMSTEELVHFMHQCIDLGVTTFDTAEIYGNYGCEKEMGAAFKLDPSLRSKIQLVTKTGINKAQEDNQYTMNHYDTRYDKVMRSIHSSLEKLNTDYIDLYLIHREDPFMDIYSTAQALKEIMDKGLAKAVGVSNFNPIQFAALQKACGGLLVCNQIEVSPLQFEHFNNNNLDFLQQENVHPMFWSPLAGGRIFNTEDHQANQLRSVLEKLSHKYDCSIDSLVYAWLLKHPVQGIAISGSFKIERLENAVKALNIQLDHEDWYRIYLASTQQRLR